MFTLRISIFNSCDLDIQQTKTLGTTVEEGQIKIIPAKFGPNLASILGEKVA